MTAQKQKLDTNSAIAMLYIEFDVPCTLPKPSFRQFHPKRPRFLSALLLGASDSPVKAINTN